MNHILGTLKRSCGARVNIAELHRRGPLQTDRFGADFAVSVNTRNFKKLAVFQLKRIENDQLKRIENDRVTILRKQLDDATNSGLPKRALFVLAANPDRFDFRVCCVQSLRRDWNGDSKSKEVDPSGWLPLIDWVEKWLQCEIGGLKEGEQESALTMLKDDNDNGSLWRPAALIEIDRPNFDFELIGRR